MGRRQKSQSRIRQYASQEAQQQEQIWTCRWFASYPWSTSDSKPTIVIVIVIVIVKSSHQNDHHHHHPHHPDHPDHPPPPHHNHNHHTTRTITIIYNYPCVYVSVCHLLVAIFVKVVFRCLPSGLLVHLPSLPAHQAIWTTGYSD